MHKLKMRFATVGGGLGIVETELKEEGISKT